MIAPDIAAYLARNKPEKPADCVCQALFDPNPTCPPHGWWHRDKAVLDLADLTRELGSAWDAAVKTFGGQR